MAIQLANCEIFFGNSKPYQSYNYSTGDEILVTIPFSVDVLEYLKVEESDARDVYLDKLLDAILKHEREHNKTLCLHLRAKGNDVSAFVHGFLWVEENSGLLTYHTKLRVQLSLSSSIPKCDEAPSEKEIGLLDLVFDLSKEQDLNLDAETELTSNSERACVKTATISEKKSVDFPISVLQDFVKCVDDPDWRNWISMTGVVSLTLFSKDEEADPGNEEVIVITNKILTEGIQSDMVIVASDDIEIPCHKSFLAAQSPVFAAMFERELEESKTGRVVISEMSGETVKAFLRYIYTGDLALPGENSKIALDLLKASHKYDISNMETKLQDLLLRKPNNWFDFDDALNLLLFARNADVDNDRYKKIQRKAILAMSVLI